jgi:hypothetical protein
MKRDLNNNFLGGVLSWISSLIGISLELLMVLFFIVFFAIGWISLVISSGAMSLIYFLFWIFRPAE